VLSFERFKWGGTGRDDVVYVAFDLEQFARYPGYAKAFIAYSQRKYLARRHVFWHYPICWWTAADGINTDALRPFLPSSPDLPLSCHPSKASAGRRQTKSPERGFAKPADRVGPLSSGTR
jgi:hypothetical protein